MIGARGAGPVGVAQAKDGPLLFSEDGNGTIWLVSYVGHAFQLIAVRDRRFYRDQPRTDTLVQNQFGLAGIVTDDSVPTLRLFAKQQAFEHGLKASDEFSIPLCRIEGSTATAMNPNNGKY